MILNFAVYPRWRTLFGMSDKEFDARFIPAGAGNTLSRVCPVRGIAVYPRWRGEHALLLSQIRESGRFIPAGAGNTEREGQTVNNAPVYPRWRGEHTCEIFSVFGIDGLSPLARGTRGNLPGDNVYGRFIPAGAGNTSFAHPRVNAGTVYPRWRGEHATTQSGDNLTFGLSPLARGTQLPGVSCSYAVRFIPAGAGNTRVTLSGRE